MSLPISEVVYNRPFFCPGVRQIINSFPSRAFKDLLTVGKGISSVFARSEGNFGLVLNSESISDRVLLTFTNDANDQRVLSFCISTIFFHRDKSFILLIIGQYSQEFYQFGDNNYWILRKRK